MHFALLPSRVSYSYEIDVALSKHVGYFLYNEQANLAIHPKIYLH